MTKLYVVYFLVIISDYKTMNNNQYDMADVLAKYEEDNKRLIREKNEIMTDFNARMKVHLEEIRLLKEVNEGLQTDLGELRDLCCYLDDDRHKCRNLAKEWQNFGRYVSSILQSKESSYQEEVNSFNVKHETIIAENNNLKRLCQDLEKRSNSYEQSREFVCIRCSQRLSIESNGGTQNQHSSTNSPTRAINLSYTQRNSHKTDERNTDDDSPVFSPNGNMFAKVTTGGRRKKKVSFAEPDEMNHSGIDQPKHIPFNTDSNGLKGENTCHGILRNGTKKSHSTSDYGSSSSNDSDSSTNNMNRAMQVLEIHSKLQGDQQNKQEPLEDKDVAALKEMCNVVWRKLSSDKPSNGTSENQPLTNEEFADDIIYEDLL